MNIKKIYQHAVLFITLVMMIGGGINIFSSVSDILFPQPYYESLESFQEMKKNEFVANGSEGETPTKEQLEKEYDVMKKNHLHEQSMYAKKNLIRSLGWVLVPFPFFFLTRRQIKVEKEESVENK